VKSVRICDLGTLLFTYLLAYYK